MRSAMDLFDFEKSANLKHPNVYPNFGLGQGVGLYLCEFSNNMAKLDR